MEDLWSIILILLSLLHVISVLYEVGKIYHNLSKSRIKYGGILFYIGKIFGNKIDDDYQVVYVSFATNRKSISDHNSIVYGSDRSPMTYGQCIVTIPLKEHEKGKIERPSITKLQFRENINKHIILQEIIVEESEDFFNDLSERIYSTKGKKAFIFIHGYNVNFENAALQTAQMYFDLRFEGEPIFFSWPSYGDWAKYSFDETNIQWAQKDIENFLIDFLNKTQVDHVYIIAHSMGNRAMTEAVCAMIEQVPEAKNKIKEIILAAPDIDAEVFKRSIAPEMTKEFDNITLYCSGNDKALYFSKKFNGFSRIGDSSDGIHTIKGIETIDATNVETDFLAHSYFGSTNDLLSDIYYIIDGKRADERYSLMKVEHQPTHYWKFAK